MSSASTAATPTTHRLSTSEQLARLPLDARHDADNYGDRRETAFVRPAGVVDATICVPSGLKPTPLCGKTTTDIFAKD